MFKTRTRTKVLIGATVATGVGAVVCGHMEKTALASACDDLIELNNIGDIAEDVGDEAVENVINTATSFTA